MFLIELIHEHALRPVSSPALERWIEAAGAFWSTLIFGVADHAELALGYMVDEVTFALGNEQDAGYSLLRILCLQRLAAGIFMPDGGDCGTIERLIAALEPAVLPASPGDDPKRRKIAEGTAQILVHEGMEAVTHRSVALAAQVPASTVVYHFGTQPALVMAGLNAVILRFHGMLERVGEAYTAPKEDAETRNVTKATSMLALASLREPSLLSHALEMRRRRGDRIRASDLPGLGFQSGAGFDRAAGQVIALAVYGMRMVAMARQIPERASYRSAFRTLEAGIRPHP